jgi:hypothetical protein
MSAKSITNLYKKSQHHNMNKIRILHAYRAQHKGKEKRVQFIDV